MEKSSIMTIVLTFLIAAGALWVTLAWMSSDDTFIDLETNSYSLSDDEKTGMSAERYRFAVATIWSPRETFLRYHRFGVKLGRLMGRKESMVIRSSYREVREDLENNRIDAALVCTGTVLNATENDAIEVIAVPEFEDGWDFRGLIVVNDSSSLVSLEDLEGTVMALSDPESFTGCTLPCAVLLSVTKELDGFLHDVVFTGSHDRNVEAVFSHLVDSAAVNSLIYHQIRLEHPDIGEKTRILWQSERFGPPCIVVPSGIAQAEKEKLKAIILSFHEDPDGQKILEELRISRLIVPGQDTYDSARAVFDKIRSAGGCPWH